MSTPGAERTPSPPDSLEPEGLRGTAAGAEPSPIAGRNPLVVTYWASGDALISRYTMPYVRMIRDHLEPGERITVVTFDPPGSRHCDLAEDRIDHVAFRYDGFGAGAIIRRALDIPRLVALCRRRRIGVIHSWCSTGGAIGWLLSAVTRRPLVLDSFEPHADSMVENGTWSPDSIRFKLLLLLERLQTRRASAAIAVSPWMAGYSRRRYGRVPSPLYLKPACVDLDDFRPADHEPGDEEAREELIGVYAGKFGGIYLESEAFELMRILTEELGPQLRFLILTPAEEADVMRMAAAAGLPPEKLAVRLVDPEAVPGELRRADFAINFVRPVPTRLYNTSIKDAEYLACGLPVLIADGISDDSKLIADNDAGAVFASLDPNAYRVAARRIGEILRSEPAGERRARIRELAVRHRSLDSARSVYASLYGNRRPGTGRAQASERVI